MGSYQHPSGLSFQKKVRLPKCREFALEAERLARTARTSIQQHYIAIADHWWRVSAEIEAER